MGLLDNHIIAAPEDASPAWCSFFRCAGYLSQRHPGLRFGFEYLASFLRYSRNDRNDIDVPDATSRVCFVIRPFRGFWRSFVKQRAARLRSSARPRLYSRRTGGARKDAGYSRNLAFNESMPANPIEDR
jgi:hypothetical protein